MAEPPRGRTTIWLLSGMLAVLGASIALLAAMEYFTATLVMVGLAALVTVGLGIVLSRRENHDRS
ncbi:MAG: hypothetical protein HLX51_06975 [Micrococcaceae bacterium]|nr:hypothetical protein [Micrococcaceae bacterium]